MGEVLAVRRITGHFLVLAVAGALAGCGSSGGTTGGSYEAFDLLRERLRGFGRGEEAAGPAAEPSRASIAAFTDPLILARVDDTGGLAFMVRTRSYGATAVWQSTDQVSITLVGGLLRATRGMGDDLMSADVPGLGEAAAFGREHYYIGGDARTRLTTFACRRESLGPETITVLERAYSTRHITETCTAGEADFTNDYWVDSRGVMRKSRQWVSKGVGYVTLQRVVD